MAFRRLGASNKKGLWGKQGLMRQYLENGKTSKVT